jgi:hypothetical protein
VSLHPIEAEAVDYADTHSPEDLRRAGDWGRPGKNHRGPSWSD